MDKFNFGYSTKNIPIPNEKYYKSKLLEKIEAVVKRMRWKFIFAAENSKNDDERIVYDETYGLKSVNCPPVVKELIEFENDLFNLVKKINFRRSSCKFQRKLNADIKKISSSSKIFTPADKTSNLYKLDKEDYNRFVNNAVTSNYKKVNKNIAKVVNNQGKAFAKKKNIINRLQINGTNDCFITLKDHKENFLNNPTTRLLNPAKNEIGRISKHILDRVNTALRASLSLNQWQNSIDVIQWFNNIRDKSHCKFIIFDIKDFYPSIKQDLLSQALEFASNYITVSSEDLDIIHHARKSLLYNNDEPWLKKESGLFDVTMGAYDGAEICELVGIFLQSRLINFIDKHNIGLYRDDGLAILRNISGPQSERVKKAFQKVFNDYHLKLEIKCNVKIVDYLDLTLNLIDGSHRPFHKPNDETLYINANSNHPPCIIKQTPIAIENRLRLLSSSEKIFNEAAPHYQNALEKSGYSYKLSYKRPTTQDKNNSTSRRNRKRQIIWFNPPYNKDVTTNIGKYFLNFIHSHHHIKFT